MTEEYRKADDLRSRPGCPPTRIGDPAVSFTLKAMSREVVKLYRNGDVVVTWKPALCRHSGICARGLPRVFDPTRRPWIDLAASDTATIIAQVERCPSGALSWSKEQ